MPQTDIPELYYIQNKSILHLGHYESILIFQNIKHDSFLNEVYEEISSLILQLVTA